MSREKWPPHPWAHQVRVECFSSRDAEAEEIQDQSLARREAIILGNVRRECLCLLGGPSHLSR